MLMIDVVVVTYNSGKYLPRLAASLRASSRIATVTIVDNGSQDDSVAIARKLDWGADATTTVLKENPGFGAGMNYGAFTEAAFSPQILIINPDVSVSAATLAALSTDLELHPRIGVVGASLATEFGTSVSSARNFPNLRTIARRTVHNVRHEGKLTEVDWLCGALMLWRREAFESIGGFSTEFFLYFEDVDICKRAWLNGWSVSIDGRHEAIHDQGHGQKTSRALVRASRRSRRSYARKWHGLPGIVACALADAGDIAADLYHTIKGK